MTAFSALASIFTLSLAVVAGDQLRLRDLDGRAIDPFAGGPRAAAMVFVFVRPDCPVSNRYAPELARMHDRFASRGVTFTLVYPGDAAATEAIRNHVHQYGYPFAALRDPDLSFAGAVAATVMPEAAVFDAYGTLRYLGRIDDRYISAGRARPAPTRRDLEEALESILAGRPVRAERTPAIGCLIADLR
ncbi:MAG: redoxin domain-containing protein [Vicinamibacterales bacterium]